MSTTNQPPPTVLTHVLIAVPYVVGLFVQVVEKVLFLLVDLYDKFMYTPIQRLTSPIVARIPRNIVRNDKVYTVFSANIVSWARTLLVVPIAYCLKYQFHWTAFSLVILHDFLDHIDGIVAKVQTSLYGRVDDPLLGGFMDAFCDKIVNVSCLWTILIVTDFSKMSGFQCFVYLTSCTIIIVYEFTLGVVRVQDYFRAYYDREYNREKKGSTSLSINAGMEGKLKEKLESMGIAFLCLAQTGFTAMDTKAGIVGVVCLLLSVRLAHASLMRKINARYDNQETKPSDDEAILAPRIQRTKPRVDDDNRNVVKTQTEVIDSSGVDVSTPFDPLLSHNLECQVDEVYTVGCFDVFHKGHATLLGRMRKMGKKLIVGVHDSRSIYRLKRQVPMDSTEVRMRNVKLYADIVYCVAGTDPSTFIMCAVPNNEGKKALYVRGADMVNFPARGVVEELMDVKFLPYTEGISSSKLRKELLHTTLAHPSITDEVNLFY